MILYSHRFICVGCHFVHIEVHLVRHMAERPGRKRENGIVLQFSHKSVTNPVRYKLNSVRAPPPLLILRDGPAAVGWRWCARSHATEHNTAAERSPRRRRLRRLLHQKLN